MEALFSLTLSINGRFNSVYIVLCNRSGLLTKNLNRMNKTIWKFELETTDNQTLKMPVGAEILTVQTQFDKPCLWALVDPNAEKEDRFIEIFGTGHPVGYDMGVDRKHISTYQLHGGSLVFHVFEYKGV